WPLHDYLLEQIAHPKHGQGGKVDILVGGGDRESFTDMLISFEGDQQVVIARRQVAEAEGAVLVGYGKFGFGGIRLRCNGDGGVVKDLFARGVDDLSFYGPPDLCL